LTYILSNLWAKTDREDSGRWHPLVLHLLDVAASADAVLMREPESFRLMLGACLGMPWPQALPWILILIACHDLGKACPGFQCKWPGAPATGLKKPKSPNMRINHGFVSQVALARILRKIGWAEDLAELVADAVGCHHGARAAPTSLYHLKGDRRAIGTEEWSQARLEIFDALFDVFRPSRLPEKKSLSGPEFMILSGLASFADWIGSNGDWFPFESPEFCNDLPEWFRKRRIQADFALDTIGWGARTPLISGPRSFELVFGFEPRPLQKAVSEAVANLAGPATLLVEAPMGEGKTEAAFYAAVEMQSRFGHRGIYFALPTKATGNAMFTRTLEFLESLGADRKLDLQLIHGAALLNDKFQSLRLAGIYGAEKSGAVRAGEWFTNKKRALLSEYGVGTVDQAILPILPVKHNFVRLWGLANRVVIFDEIHAYDAYTGTLLAHLLRWLAALGSSVLLLSATLPPSIRRKLADTISVRLPEKEVHYPRVSVFCQAKDAIQSHFEADPSRRLTLRIEAIGHELPAVLCALRAHLADGGMGLALVNTVQRAQDLYQLFPPGQPLEMKGQRIGKRLPDGTEVLLFHARFPADRRQAREEAALRIFGESGDREGRKILVATQVAEQSLDLDFDLIATDLAPIDLILQRAGREWRHTGRCRPISEPVLLVAGLDGAEPPPLEKPLWWSKVYREDILLRTWSLLRDKRFLRLPDEIDDLVRAVYEELAETPEDLGERLDDALFAGEGEAISKVGQANEAIIGLPDDESWNEPSRFVLYDEDEPGVHRNLMAQTRLGEDSALAVPLWPEDGYDLRLTPDFSTAKEWFLRSVSLSRGSVVRALESSGVPDGWKESPLLRNCFALELNAWGQWIRDMTVRLDKDLGVVYESEGT
jgi:CRISPR-associated endonuclease/helicase Cas3